MEKANKKLPFFLPQMCQQTDRTKKLLRCLAHHFCCTVVVLCWPVELTSQIHMLWFYQTWLSLRAPVALVCAIIPLVKINVARRIVCLCVNINECLNHQTHNAELFCFVMCKQSQECKNCKLYIVQCTIFLHVPVGIYSTYYVHLFIFNSRVTEGHTRVKRLLDWFYFYKKNAHFSPLNNWTNYCRSIRTFFTQ
jgi:hypothetical protein